MDNGQWPLRVEQVEAHPFTGETQALVDTIERWRNQLLDYAVQRPLEASLALLTGGALVFYLAEKDVNERVESYTDALYYISTCFSVGYANIFAMTPTGKLVSTLLMTIGPSISTWIVEGRLIESQRAAGLPEPAAAAPQVDMAPVVEKLDAILQELRLQREASESRG